MEIGKLVAYLTLDDSQFRSGIGNAESAMSKLTGGAKAAGQVAASMFAGAAATATTLSANLFKTGASYNALQQNSRAALRTILGSTEAVNRQMAKLDDLASKSPFSKSVFIEGQQQLLAFGMEAEKVIPTMNAVQNAVAATGGSGQQLSDLIFVMAQIQAAGKITGQDLLQMGQRGINAAELIGDAFGMTAAEAKDAISKNKISAEDALDAMVNGMTKKFGGATGLIKEQWGGTKDRIKASWRDTGVVIAKPFIDPNGGGQAVIWGNLVADTMRNVQKKTIEAMVTVEQRTGPVFTAVTKGLQRANAAVAGFDLKGFTRQLDGLAKYTPLVAGATGALTALGMKPLPVIGALGTGMGPLLVGMATLGASSPKVREAGAAFVDALGPAAPILGDAAQGAGDLAMQLINTLAPHLVTVAEGAGNFAATMAPLAVTFMDAAKAGVPLVDVAGQLVGMIANLPAPVLAAAGAMVAFHGPLSGLKGAIMGVGPLATAAATGIRAFVQDAAQFGVVATMRGHVSSLAGSFTGLLTPANLVGAGLMALAGIVAASIASYAQMKAQISSLAESYDDLSGSVTDATRAAVVKMVTDDDLAENYVKMGGNVNRLVDALLGEADAQAEVAKLVELGNKAHEDSAHATGEEYQRLIDLSNATAEFARRYEHQQGIMSEAQKLAQLRAEAHRGAASATREEADALAGLLRAQQKMAAANGDWVAAQYATKDALAKSTEAVAQLGEAVKDANGNIDVTADANKDMVLSARDHASAIRTEIEAYAAMGKTQTEVNEKLGSLKEGFYANAEALGLSRDQAVAFGDAVGLIPEHKATVIDMMVDSEAAQHELDALIHEAKTAEGMLTLDATTAPAAAELAKMLGLIETSEGVFDINADEDPALAKLFATVAQVNTETGVMKIDGNNAQAMDRLAAAKNNINSTAGYIKIDGVDYATATARRIANYISGMRATIQIATQQTGNSYNPAVDRFADGGLVDGRGVRFFAGGGVEHHTAQIAPAGAWRVWAEDETGGEAYIPLSQSKRNRSQQIMAEVARRFGDIYIPANTKRFADGTGGHGVASATAGAGISLAGLEITGTLEISGDSLAKIIDGRVIGAIHAGGGY